MAMEEGVIIRWLKKVGDPVEKGEPGLEVETDKTKMEVEADYEGVLLAILRQEGETVPVTEVIGWIGKEGESIPEAPAVSGGADQPDAAPEPGAETVQTLTTTQPAAITASGGDGIVRATPAARRIAEEMGIELSTIVPSGTAGEIRERDVLASGPGVVQAGAEVRATPLVKRMAEKRGIDLSAVKGSGPGGKIFARDLDALEEAEAAGKAGAKFSPRLRAQTPAADETVPLTGIQKITARRMVQSHTDIPPVTIAVSADVTRMLKARREMNSEIEDAKITVTDLAVRAAALALRSHPRCNAEFREDHLLVRGSININIAVDTEQGLMVPAVKNADLLSLPELSREIKRVAGAARKKTLKTEDTEGGTFTVSNVGMQGVTYFTPIINQPQTAILGVCAVEERVVRCTGGAGSGPDTLPDGFKDVSLMNLCLTFDHRALDGAEAARFLNAVKNYLEKPFLLLVEG
jgi:pyruvate dehydrogenase E2 component (dihydrolipoamide acetyltransferase)